MFSLNLNYHVISKTVSREDIFQYRTCYTVGKKVKGKGCLWALQHCCLEAYCTLTRM